MRSRGWTAGVRNVRRRGWMSDRPGTRLFYDEMDTALGLLGLVGYIVGILILSAAATALVVRISPTSRKNG